MLRAITTRSARLSQNARLFSTSIRTMAEGDTGSGASRPGGQAQADAWSQREKANEDYYVRQQEAKKLESLRKKIAEQRKNLDELEKSVEEIDKQGGQQK